MVTAEIDKVVHRIIADRGVRDYCLVTDSQHECHHEPLTVSDVLGEFLEEDVPAPDPRLAVQESIQRLRAAGRVSFTVQHGWYATRAGQAGA